MKVLVSDNIASGGIEILKKADLEVDVKTGMTEDELRECISEYDGIVIRSATKLTSDIIDAATNLKVIGRAGSGLDNVDKITATKKGIYVMNTPGGNTITTAEHTIALIFAVARNIPQATNSLKSQKWEKKRFMGIELFNKTLGIIGIGNIGSQVAKRMQAFNMNIIAYDPFLNEELALEMGVKKVSLEELFGESDFITIHTPLTPETDNLINRDTIAIMKDGVRIINCARGGIVNERDLHDAILSGKVAGAALDVLQKEPPDDYSLISLDNVICTPHLGAATEEAQVNVAIAIAEQIVDFLINNTIRNAVNFPSIPADQVEKLSPYLLLAERLGTFASQIFEEEVVEIDIALKGEASEIDSEPVKIAAIKGFLTPILEETVNFVNAPFIAKERGIGIKETKGADAGDYHSMIGLNIKTRDKAFSLYGTLFSRKDPRIIRVNNHHIEIVPEGVMLFIKNLDRPGVIGGIGTILGENNINISRMHFGRESKEGMAISVVSVDEDVKKEIIEEMRKLPNILDVKLIRI